jgi:hypothetical protein
MNSPRSVALVAVLALPACTASRVTSSVDRFPVPADDDGSAPRYAVVAPGRYAERVAGCLEGSGLFEEVWIGEVVVPGAWSANSELWLAMGPGAAISPVDWLLLFVIPTGGLTTGIVEIDVTSPRGERATLTWDFEEEWTIWLFSPVLRLFPGWTSRDGAQGEAFARALGASGLLGEVPADASAGPASGLDVPTPRN